MVDIWQTEHETFSEKDKRQAKGLPFPYHIQLNSTFNLIGTEASCTDVDMAGRTIDDSFHALYVGLPHSVGTSVGVGDLNTKGNTLATIITLRHNCTSYLK